MLKIKTHLNSLCHAIFLDGSINVKYVKNNRIVQTNLSSMRFCSQYTNVNVFQA